MIDSRVARVDVVVEMRVTYHEHALPPHTVGGQAIVSPSAVEHSGDSLITAASRVADDVRRRVLREIER